MKKNICRLRERWHRTVLFVSLFFLSAGTASSLLANNYLQKSLKQDPLNIFLDISGRYRRYTEYIKTEIPYVNYMRDRKQADVFVMVTTQKTGSNGTEFTVTFLGLEQFAAMNDTLLYISKKTDTDLLIRNGLIQTLKIGLMRYVAHTPAAKSILISYPDNGTKIKKKNHNKWNHWVFGINASSRLSGEESTTETNVSGALSADRVTEQLKMSAYARAEYNHEEYDLSDYHYSSISRSYMFRTTVVKSFGEHWSAGVSAHVNSSTYSNAKLNTYISPAIEYDVFPYSESTRRQFRIMYRLGYHDNNYLEETVYSKTGETLYSQRLDATFELRETWGSVNTTISGLHYLHDFSKNHLRLSGYFSVRVFEGFELTAHGRVSMIHDQLSLEKEEVSEEEILLQQKQLSTQYNYSLWFGVRFTFGSIYNNVVNPRFGN